MCSVRMGVVPALILVACGPTVGEPSRAPTDVASTPIAAAPADSAAPVARSGETAVDADPSWQPRSCRIAVGEWPGPATHATGGVTITTAEDLSRIVFCDPGSDPGIDLAAQRIFFVILASAGMGPEPQTRIEAGEVVATEDTFIVRVEVPGECTGDERGAPWLLVRVPADPRPIRLHAEIHPTRCGSPAPP